MFFVPFHEYFPDVSKGETRELYIKKQPGTKLLGGYGLLEMYCKDPDCDCRRVILNVVSEKELNTVAYINFGWESMAFYRKWYGKDDVETIEELKGPSLNALSPQSKYAPELLQFIKEFVLKDKNYVNRLKRHYKMFKEKMRVENSHQNEN